jgi:hypothetical protein
VSYLLVGKRAKDMASVADANRLSYSADDPHNCARPPFTLFTQTSGLAATNTLTGRLHGVTVHGFDFPYLLDPEAARAAGIGAPGGPPLVAYDDGRPHGAAAVFDLLPVPWIHLSPRGRKPRIPADVEIPLGDGRLTKLFAAWSDHPDAAAELLSGPVADLLVGTKGQFTFEIHTTGLLSVVGNIRPEDFPAFMAMTVRLHDVLEATSDPKPVGAVAAVAAALSPSAAGLPHPPPGAPDMPLPPPPPDAATAPLPPPPAR